MTAANVDILRRGWTDAVSALAPALDELPKLLDARLDEAVRRDELDELALLRVIDEASSVAVTALPPAEATSLTRRLQRAVYEYLLSLDAMRPEEVDESHHEPSRPHHPDLIGAEEVAALAGRYAEIRRLEVVRDDVETAAGENAESVPVADEDGAAPEVEPDEGEPDGESDPPGAPAEPKSAEPVSRRPRFTLFRGRGDSAAEELEAPVVDAPPAETPAAPAASAAPPAEAPAPPTPAERPAPQFVEVPSVSAHPELAQSGGGERASKGASAPFVAPRDGFHLSDVSDVSDLRRSAADDAELHVSEPDAADETATPASESGDEEPVYGGKGWRVRGRRSDHEPRRAPRTVLSGPEDAELLQAMQPEQQAELLNRFETDPDIVEARRQIRDRLRRRRCDEAAALLQALAQDLGGRAVAELALDAGDRCRALGKNNAALSCYLAASRADPVQETPLMRLADICLDDHDIDLAASYLERVARLHRLRGDDAGALRIYRKLATIAPFREDILSMLVRAQATGRFDD